jgi:DnaK suppressor protein
LSEGAPDIDLDEARERLEAERDRVRQQLAGNERNTQGDLAERDNDTDLADVGEQVEEEEVDQAIHDSLRRELAAIDRALERVEDGSYGVSVDSGEPIPAERLMAIPWAERTPEEQERFERTHGRPW